MSRLGNLIWETSSEMENSGSPPRPLGGLWNWVGQPRHAHYGKSAPPPGVQPRPCRRANGDHGNAVAVVQRLGPDPGAGLGGAESACHMTRGRSLCGDGRSVSLAFVS